MTCELFRWWQAAGIGKMQPNILLMGMKSDWQTCDQDQVEQFVNIILDAFRMDMSVMIVCGEGFPLITTANRSLMARFKKVRYLLQPTSMVVRRLTRVCTCAPSLVWG